MTVYKKGFTLIELLIVMAILGVLAVVVLVAINPVQQLARTRDAGRKSTVAQLGHATEAYFTAHNGEYLTAANCTADSGGDIDTTWMGCLQFAGELSSVPGQIGNTQGTFGTCADPGVNGGEDNQICYDNDGTGDSAVLYTILESQSEESKCAAAFDANYAPFFIWSTEDGRGGTVCFDCTGGVCTAPSPGTSYGASGAYLEN